MDLNLIRIFVAVYGNGSYTQAARALNISQPAVSQAIKRLEDSVGMPLFIRQGRGITPTAKAVSMAEPLETAMNLINGAFSSERRLLGYGVEAVLHSIGKLDGIKFVLPPSDQSQALDDLRTNKVELMVDNVMTEDPAFVSELLSEQPIVVVCREQHPRLTTETMTREAFYNEEHVVLKTRRGGSQLLDVLTPESLEPRNETMEVTALSGMAMMISSSDLIGIMPVSFARLWANKLSLKIMPMPIESLPLALHLVYHRRFTDDQHHRSIREQIRERVNQHL